MSSSRCNAGRLREEVFGNGAVTEWSYHAVTGAGTGSFAYDAVGNQIARPGGTTLR